MKEQINTLSPNILQHCLTKISHHKTPLTIMTPITEVPLCVSDAYTSSCSWNKIDSENRPLFNEKMGIRNLIKNMDPASVLELPEVEPTPAKISELQELFSAWGIGDLVRYTATLTKTGNLTRVLDDALKNIPGHKLRELCIYVLAKMEANHDRGWTIKKSGAVLTARCKKIMARRTY
ncbi:MAG: hypothetical protein AB7E95_08670 [Kiritimatiellales bacterium]